MINQLLHRQPVPVDRDQHRQTHLALPITDWSLASRLNSVFVAASELGDACREYTVVFVRAGTEDDGKPQIAPIAVLGLQQEDNLYLDGQRWRARYQPAILRMYPFCIARLDDQQFAVCMDAGWSGISTSEGQALFTPEGEQAPLLASAQQQLELMEAEVQRTRMACQELVALDLLRDMRFDATLPDGRKHSIDGFLTVDDTKVLALPDAKIAELQRKGLLGFINAHWLSLGNMSRLLEWHIERHGNIAANAATPT